MDLVIEHKKRNELLGRDEISAAISSNVTPKKEEIKDALAQQLPKDASLVVVKTVKGKFGSKDFLARAYAYDNLESLKKFEVAVKKEKKPDAGKPEEAGKENTEKEVKKEEKKAE